MTVAALGTLVLSTAVLAAIWATTTSKKGVVGSSSFLGSTLQVRRNPLSFLSDAVARHGSTFQMRYFGGNVTVVSDVESVKRVLEDKTLSFFSSLHELFPLAGRLESDQESYLERRTVVELIKTCMTPNLKRFTPVAVREFETASVAWLQRLRNAAPTADAAVVVERPFDMVMDMVARGSISVFVGSELRDDPTLLKMAMTLTIDLSNSLRRTGFLLFFPRLNLLLHRLMFIFYCPLDKHLRKIAQVIEPKVRDYLRARDAGETKADYDCMFDYMLEQYTSVTDSSPEKDKREMIRVLAVQLRSLIFAAVHTTTTNATLVLYYLVHHAPQCMAELLEEQREVLGPNRTITFDSLKHMKKLDSFIREVFRYSVVGITLGHRCISTDRAGPYELPNGSKIPSSQHIYLNATAIHRNEDLQGPQPDAFDPWRFLHNGRQAIKSGPDYLHFGHGPHACPGRFFAIQEIKAVISLIITQYHVTNALPNGQEIDLGPYVEPWIPSVMLHSVKIARSQ
ncbi:hypothetical protein RI367_006423 [Sorochytrium milnesiophthora]